MQIVILGAGALGSLFGARLAKTKHDVTLFSTNTSHMEAIKKSGLIIEELDGTSTTHFLFACDNPDALKAPPDLVLVVVKSYAIDEAMQAILRKCSPDTLFLTLQNGIGNWERISRHVGRQTVLVGTTAQGATLLEPGKIRHGGNGPTFIGEPEGAPTSRVSEVVELFANAGLKTEARAQMKQLIWEKLHINVGINAITALTGIRNGFIASNPAARELCRSAVMEAISVARAQGIAIDSDMVERVLAVAEATAVNRSSMGQDVDRRRRTEIEAINGAIVALGEQAGIPTPVNRTLTLLVKTLEANYLMQE